MSGRHEGPGHDASGEHSSASSAQGTRDPRAGGDGRGLNPSAVPLHEGRDRDLRRDLGAPLGSRRVARDVQTLRARGAGGGTGMALLGAFAKTQEAMIASLEWALASEKTRGDA